MNLRPIACLFAFLAAPAAAFEATDCLILPSREIEIGATVPGLLADVAVDRGDTVAAGQVVARLRSEVQESVLGLARARAASSAALQAAEARLSYARQELERGEELLQGRIISQQLVDERRTTYEVRLREYEEAQVDAELARLEVGRAEAELEVRRIRSPIDGVVTVRSRDPGEYLRDDGSVLTVARLDPLHVEIFLPQDLYGRLAVGDRLPIRASHGSETVRDAIVEVIDPVIDPSSATFGVRLALPNPGHEVVGGLRCVASLPIPMD